MSKLSKLQKFAQVKEFPNVIESSHDDVKSIFAEWQSDYDQTILELAAGKCDYTLGLAEMYPDKLVVGVDIQGERLWSGSTRATERGLGNARFMRINIEQLSEFVTDNSIDQIWITFPDPFPRKKQAKKRLTSPRFIWMYSNVLKPSGTVNLKTDSIELFDYSEELLVDNSSVVIEQSIRDIYLTEDLTPELKIKTDFEIKHLARGRTINYLRFHFI